MARDGKCSVHRNPSLAISASALGLPIVRETHSRGSLIPQAINRLGEVANALQARLIFIAIVELAYSPRNMFELSEKPFLR